MKTFNPDQTWRKAEAVPIARQRRGSSRLYKGPVAARLPKGIAFR